jgi:hypothetical protein
MQIKVISVPAEGGEGMNEELNPDTEFQKRRTFALKGQTP